jgi:hypothetical protein
MLCSCIEEEVGITEVPTNNAVVISNENKGTIIALV